ncbi:MAG: M23 family metallopeptidase [Lachnospiraceae bacterium]|nr:M23 family metallopeptidase [Lachnospiraceae bacterium]
MKKEYTIKKATKKLLITLLCSTTFLSISNFIPPNVFQQVPSLAITVSAASTTNKVPITCYPLNGRITTYTDTRLNVVSGYIDPTDRCQILQVYNTGAVKVKYPTSKGDKVAFAPSTGFFVDTNFSTSSTKMGRQVPVYTTATSETSIGTVFADDQILIIGVIGNRTQIVYPINGGYKMGFVKLVPKSNTNNNSTSFRFPLTNYYVCGNNWSTYYKAKNGDHLGIDIKSQTGDTNVYAFADGTVTQSGWNSANGNCVVIAHTISGKTVYIFYGHLQSRSVSVGQKVSKGSKIGIIGNTGSSSTGVHLHFAITTQNSCGTWGYTQNQTFNNNANSVSWKGYTYYNPYYVIQNGKLP